MPQLDINLFDDFLFFGFVALLFGMGDDESEESVIEMGTDIFLAQYYLEVQKILRTEVSIVRQAFVHSI